VIALVAVLISASVVAAFVVRHEHEIVNHLTINSETAVEVRVDGVLLDDLDWGHISYTSGANLKVEGVSIKNVGDMAGNVWARIEGAPDGVVFTVKIGVNFITLTPGGVEVWQSISPGASVPGSPEFRLAVDSSTMYGSHDWVVVFWIQEPTV